MASSSILSTNNKLILLVLLLFANFMFGDIGDVTRTLTNDNGLSLVEITFIRQFGTALILFIGMFIISRKTLHMRKEWVLPLVIMGVDRMLMDYTLFFAIDRIPMGIATLLQMTCPFFVLMFSFFIFGNDISIKKFVAVIAGTIGCVLCMGLAEGMDLDILGVIVGLISGAGYGAYMICARIASNNDCSPFTVLFYVSLIAALTSLPFVLGNLGHMFTACTQDLYTGYVLFMFIIMMTIVPYIIIFISVPKLGTTATSMICMTEFIFSALIGFFFYNESLSTIKIVGMTVMALSILLINIEITREDSKICKFLNSTLFKGPEYTKRWRKSID